MLNITHRLWMFSGWNTGGTLVTATLTALPRAKPPGEHILPKLRFTAKKVQH